MNELSQRIEPVGMEDISDEVFDGFHVVLGGRFVGGDRVDFSGSKLCGH